MRIPISLQTTGLLIAVVCTNVIAGGTLPSPKWTGIVFDSNVRHQADLDITVGPEAPTTNCVNIEAIQYDAIGTLTLGEPSLDDEKVVYRIESVCIFSHPVVQHFQINLHDPVTRSDLSLSGAYSVQESNFVGIIQNDPNIVGPTNRSSEYGKQAFYLRPGAVFVPGPVPGGPNFGDVVPSSTK